jgi:pimeloyl-ACP methyl ester carboxylesterase
MNRAAAWLLFGLGVLAAFPCLAVVLFLIPATPISQTGLLYLLGCLVIAAGLIGAPFWRRGPRILCLGGLGLIAATVAFRLVAPPSGSRLDLVTLPAQSGPHWLNRLFNEKDLVLIGAHLAPRLGLVSRAESEGLVLALAVTYREMREATPLSPVMTTYLGQEQPRAFDAVIGKPGPDQQPQFGVIFLHGFGGNFTLQCWLVARAVEQAAGITICPSTRLVGDWWSPDGQAILAETLGYLRQVGIEHIFLAGLSNGGIGASRLAAGLESELAGLILISGADPRAAITGLPVLVIQGTHDERIPPAISAGYVEEAGPSATYLLLDGDHLLLLKRAERVQAAIRDWIAQHKPPAGEGPGPSQARQP